MVLWTLERQNPQSLKTVIPVLFGTVHYQYMLTTLPVSASPHPASITSALI